MTSLEIQQYLESFINHEIHLDPKKFKSFKLERVQGLLCDLGDPQKDLKVIHIAGSKGKGSICALTANVLMKSGYKIGLYTSPHINSYRERIRILEKTHFNDALLDIFSDMISEEELSEVIEEMKPVVERRRGQKELGGLSFFEFYTVLAIYYFNNQNVDFVILETGLGGRLDATNAIDSFMAVIVPISLEHTHILGTTIEEIAREKAAIINNKEQKVIIASQEKKAKEVLKERCWQFHINPIWVEDAVKCDRVRQDIEHQTFDAKSAKGQYNNLSLPLLGKHQRDNASVVISIMESLQELGFKISSQAIQEGFKNIFWPCRFEIHKGKPLVVLDSAHNKASIKLLNGLIKELFGNRRIIIVLGVSKDKDVNSICMELKNITNNIIFARANHPRAYEFPESLSVQVALEAAFQKSAQSDIILVTGSVFAVAEARRHILSVENHCCIK